MQDKATVYFRRLPSGEVVGEIINDAGVVIVSRNFGKISVESFNKILELLQQADPSLDMLPPIELTEN
jgi:hypothetical protein